MTVSGHTAFTTPNAKVALAAGNTTALTTATFAGTSGNEVKLRSTTPDTRATLTISGAYSITYTDVKDSAGSAGGGNIDATGGTNIDSGNNTGWTFTGAAPGDTVTISGVLYESDRTTPVAASQTVKMAVATSTVSIHATTTEVTTGAFSFQITAGTISSSTPITVFVDGNASLKAVTVTKAQATTTSPTISNLPLYQDHVIVRNEIPASTTVANNDLLNGLVAHWAFDGTQVFGTTVEDLSGQRNNGTSYNNPTSTEGRIGQSLDFNGSSSYIEVPHSSSLDLGTGNFTLSAWIKARQNRTDWRDIVDKVAPATYNGFFFQINNNYDLFCDIGSDPAGGGSLVLNENDDATLTCGSTIVDDNVWHHVVAVRNGTTRTIWVDGVVDVSGTFASIPNLNSTEKLSIGRLNVSPISQYFDGLIDDLRIYNRALSPEEIYRLYNLSYTTMVANADLAHYDSTDDSDIPYIASSTVPSLTVSSPNALLVATSTTFAPGGAVTIHGNASASLTDGSLFLASSSLYTAGGTTTIAGSLLASSSANFIPHASGTVFTATTTGKSISYATSSSLGTTTFNGSGGSWTFGTTSTTSNLTITAGTVTLPSGGLTITGNFSNSGTYTNNSATTTFNSTSAQSIGGTLTNTSALGNVSFLGAGTKTFSANASTTNLLINAGATAVAPASGYLFVAGQFNNAGTFTPGSGTTTFSGTTLQTATGTLTFGNLAVTNSSATTTFGAPMTVSGHTAFTTPNAKVALLAGATTTVNTMTIKGTSGNEVRLRSTVDGTKAGLLITGTSSAMYADIKDSNASSTDGSLVPAYNSINTGNTSGWTFLTLEAGSATISSGANQTFALNYPTTTISTITVTDTDGTVTTAQDLRIVIATSTVNMHFDTTDTTATFGGTASGKVSNPVSYEGGGSVLVITVTEDWSPADTLTIGDLSFSQFSAINSATEALGVSTDGTSITTPTDDKTVTITGSLTMANHTEGQIGDNFQFPSDSDVVLYRYRMTPAGENMTVTQTVFTLTGVNGVNQGDLSNLELWKDVNQDGAQDGGDTQVGGAGVIAINGQTGTITFSSSYSNNAATEYLLIGDIAEIRPGDMLTVGLPDSGLTASGLTSGGTVPPVGTISRVQHIKNGQGGSSSSITGGHTESGTIRSGGGQGGGGTVDSNSGETLVIEPGFMLPSANGSPQSGWTSGGNTYASDGSYMTTGTNGARHTLKGFGFSIPSNNQITGIEVRIEASVTGGAGGSIDGKISYDGGTSLTTAKNTGTPSATDVVYTLGGPSDTWGYGWTPADINNGNLALELTANTAGNTLQVDAVIVRVYHQATGGSQGGGSEVRRSPQQGDQYFALTPATMPTGIVAGAFTTRSDVQQPLLLAYFTTLRFALIELQTLLK
jgi:hypothetical protein